MEDNLLPKTGRDRRKIYIIYGLGGIGKTQLAIAYARKHQKTYSAILWLNGNSNDTLLQSLATFGRYAGISDLPKSPTSTTPQARDVEAEAKAVLRWLALEGNRRWLIVIDNVDREYGPNIDDAQAYDVLSFLPPADHGYVLITSRLLSLGEVGKSTEILRLDLEQALELLSDRSGLPRSTEGMR